MKRKIIKEGMTISGTPDLKYYAFDWDDNIVKMPTKIILKNDKGQKVGMSTEDFAKYRSRIGKENFDYQGETIVGFSEDPFVNFRTEGDKTFIIDSMLAKPGPSWNDFREAINNGSIFAIITARGHNPNTIKEAVYNYIISETGGIEKETLIKNLKKYREFANQEEMKDIELIRDYLELCRFYPVSFGEGSASEPEESKVKALDEFVSYIKELSHDMNKKAFLKNNVRNFFLPTVGFSDDDVKNLEVVKKYFKDKKDNIVKTISTATGNKENF